MQYICKIRNALTINLIFTFIHHVFDIGHWKHHINTKLIETVARTSCFCVLVYICECR